MRKPYFFDFTVRFAFLPGYLPGVCCVYLFGNVVKYCKESFDRFSYPIPGVVTLLVFLLLCVLHSALLLWFVFYYFTAHLTHSAQLLHLFLCVCVCMCRCVWV